MHIVIAGAGIAGATAAIACRLKGFDVTLLEQASSIDPVGAGLQIQPCATRVVQAIGLAENLASIGSVPSNIDFVAAHSGKLVIRGVPNNRNQEFPHYQVHRADFHSMLLDRAIALGATLELNASIQAADTGAHRATVFLQDGRAVSADLVIGADGVKSIIRGVLFGGDNPRFTGHVAYRAMVDASLLTHQVKAGVVLGPNAHFVIYPLRNGEWINVVAQMEASDWQEEFWTTRGDLNVLRQMFSGWHADVDCLLGAMTETYKWGLFTRAPMPSWSKERTVLIGDACHAALPNLGAGAAMAMEDAFLLAELLAAQPNNIQHALKKLYELRIVRCTKVQQVSARNAQLFHLANPIRRRLTHAVLGLGTTLLPGLVQRQLDWLQNYDVTSQALD